MDFELSEDTIMLRDMLRRFVEDEAKPLEMKMFARGGLEPQERARLRKVIEQMGLWGITVPEKYGGGGLDMITACVLEEELGRTFLPVELGDVPPLLYACHGDQVPRYLKPSLAGSRHPLLALREPGALHPDAWSATATPNGDGYLLNGIKTLAASPLPDDFLLVFARAPQGMSAFILEPTVAGLGITQNGGITLQLAACLVESGALLGAPGQALSLGVGQAPRESIRFGARCVGMSRRLLEMAAAYASSWQSLGGLLKDRPAVQRILADLQVQIESAHWLVYHAAWLADREEPLQVPAAQVRLVTGELVKHVTDETTLLYGGAGPAPEMEMRRYVYSTMPMDALSMGMDYARLTIAADVLAGVEEQS